jgi:hypothetical protein
MGINKMTSVCLTAPENGIFDMIESYVSYFSMMYSIKITTKTSS